MTELFLLSDAQMARISPFFRLSHGIPRSDDRRVIRSIIFVIRNGLRWRDVPPSYGPHKTIYARYDRCAHNFMSAIAIAAIVIFWI